MARKRFSLGEHRGFYTSFEQCENAMRAEKINKMLDEGIRVFGDDGPDGPGKWWEVEEATQPHGNGIDCTTKCGKTVRIYAYDATPEAAEKHGK